MSPPGPHPHWPTTQWSWLAELRTGSDEARRARALDRLYAAYNRPVLACLRELGFSPEDAEDIRQQFFLVVVEGRRLFQRAEAPRGRLRDYLRRSLKHFAANAARDRHAQKRGGDTPHESLAEHHLRDGLGATGPSPNDIFDHEWATGMLDRALRRLGDECAARGKAELWQTLQPHLARWDGPERQPAVAARLGLSASALNSELTRLRTRARHILLTQLSETAASPREADEDLSYLMRLLSR